MALKSTTLWAGAHPEKAGQGAGRGPGGPPHHFSGFAPKATLAGLLYHSGLLGISRLGVRDRLIVFNYHRIAQENGFSTPFDDEVFGPPPSIFEQQIAWLKQNI